MNIFEKIVHAWYEAKASDARIVSSFQQIGLPQATPANYEQFAKKGYQKNAMVYTCIHKIATAIGQLDWDLYQKKAKRKVEVEESPLLTLLDKPNPMQATSSFFEAVAAYYLLDGNSYIESILYKGVPAELWPCKPDKMKIVPNNDGYPGKYVYTDGSRSKTWDVDWVRFTSNIKHLKTFHPTNLWYGMSPLEAALTAMDQNNAVASWNLSLLQNSATPSGVLKVVSSNANPRGSLTNEQFARIKSEFDQSYSGSRNAGRPMLLEGGLDWTQISLSPKDMDFKSNKEISAADICMIYGVPGELVGLGEKTFNNYKEAKLAFYVETVLPLADYIAHELNAWLAPAFGDGLELCPDKDAIDAIQDARLAKYTSLGTADWLTINEKREATGYEEAEGGDVFVIGTDVVESPADLIAVDEPPPEDPAAGLPGMPKPGAPAPNDGTAKPNEGDETPQPGDAEKSFKAVNLVNKKEKKQSWRIQNAKRKRLMEPFEKDLHNDFLAMYKDAFDDVASLDPSVLEYSILSQMDKHFKGAITQTCKRHIKYTLTEFATNLIRSAKSAGIVGQEYKANLKFDQFVNSYVEKKTAKLITEIQGTTTKQVHTKVKKFVADNLKNGGTLKDLSDELTDEFSSLSPGRARNIARTEVTTASTQGSLEAVKSLQIPNMQKEWVSADDDRVRDDDSHANHEAMNGVRVELEEKFTVPPDADMDGPGDSSGGPEQVCSCRCVLVYIKGKSDE